MPTGNLQARKTGVSQHEKTEEHEAIKENRRKSKNLTQEQKKFNRTCETVVRSSTPHEQRYD